MRRVLPLTLALFGALVMGIAPVDGKANTACKAALKPFLAAARSENLSEAHRLLPNVEDNCLASVQVKAKAGLGRVHANMAKRAKEAGEPLEEVRARARGWRTFGNHWELENVLGDLSQGLEDYTSAADHYMRALDLIDDTAATPKAPDQQTVVQIHDRASQMLALSKTHVAGVTRSDRVRAYFRRNLRGFDLPTKRPQVTFITATAQFDQLGAVAINELTSIINREGSTQIVIAGHADERGDPTVNMKLSALRVIAVRKFLIDNGFRGVIGALACGVRIPPDVTDRHLRTQTELWRIARRVEVFYEVRDVPQEHRNVCQSFS